MNEGELIAARKEIINRYMLPLEQRPPIDPIVNIVPLEALKSESAFNKWKEHEIFVHNTTITVLNQPDRFTTLDKKTRQDVAESLVGYCFVAVQQEKISLDQFKTASKACTPDNITPLIALLTSSDEIKNDFISKQQNARDNIKDTKFEPKKLKIQKLVSFAIP